MKVCVFAFNLIHFLSIPFGLSWSNFFFHLIAENDGEKEKPNVDPDNLDSNFKQFDLPENITLHLNSTMVMVGYNEIALYIAGLISFFIAVFFVCFHVMLFL